MPFDKWQIIKNQKKIMTTQKSDKDTDVAISFDVEATADSPAVGSCNMIGFVVVDVNAVPTPDKKWVLHKKRWCIKEYNGRGYRCMREFWDKYPENLKYIEDHAQVGYIVAREISES